MCQLFRSDDKPTDDFEVDDVKVDFVLIAAQAYTQWVLLPMFIPNGFKFQSVPNSRIPPCWVKFE